jgi:predicted dehydrogenase
MGLRPVRAGIVGPNGIGRLHADALRRIGVEVAAVAASNERRAGEHARAMGVERWYSSPEALIDSDIDVVHICTPHYLHAPIARMALEAGKHVVSEKPLATSLPDALDLLERAKASGRVHAVCYVYRYYAHVGQLRSWVAEGRLGQVHLAHGTYLADELLVAPSPWALEPDKTGPWLTATDVGIHWFDLLEYVTGARIRSLAGTFRSVRSAPAGATAPPITDDSDAVILQLDGGMSAVAAISQAAPGHGNGIRLELNGTIASARWEQEDPDRLWWAPLAESPRYVARTAAAGASAGTLQTPKGHPQGFADAFRDLMASIYRHVRDPESLADHPTFADGVRSLRLVTALDRAVKERSWVDVEDPGLVAPGASLASTSVAS